MLNGNIKDFVVNVSFLSLKLRMTIYLATKIQIALLLVKKVIILVEYLDFGDVFLEKSANILLEQNKTNKYAIKLEKGKEPTYGPIYSLRSI